MSYKDFRKKYKHLNKVSYLTNDRCGITVPIEIYYYAISIMRVYCKEILLLRRKIEKLNKINNNKINK